LHSVFEKCRDYRDEFRDYFLAQRKKNYYFAEFLATLPRGKEQASFESIKAWLLT
jgi:hypothetical protein